MSTSTAQRVRLPAGSHVIVVHRRQDDLARYRDYLDHAEHRVTYVVTERSRAFVPEESAAAVVEVRDLTSVAQVRAAVDGPIGRFGPPAAAVALVESEFRPVIALREEFGARGRHGAQLARFLDKHAMVRAARDTGVRVPAFRLVASRAELREFGREAGWPVVTKPLAGRAGRGVHRLDDPGWLDLVDPTPDEPLLAEEYLPHPAYHVDGVWDGERLGPWRLSAYLNRPGSLTTGQLAFNLGEPLGSVEIDDPERIAAARRFLRTLVPGMSADPWSFHLEMFMSRSGDGWECTFIEVGCRPGGGPITRQWADVHGTDLFAWEFAIQCGQRPDTSAALAASPGAAAATPPAASSAASPAARDAAARAAAAGAEIAGTLYVPLPGRPCRVTRADSMLGRPGGPYREVIPAVGTEMPAGPTVLEFIGGAFWFRGASTAEVTGKIWDTHRAYPLRCRRLADPAAGERPLIALLGAGPKPVRRAAALGLRTVLVHAPGGYGAETARLCEQIVPGDFTDPGPVADRLAEIHRNTPLTRVFSLREDGLLAAATANERLGLGGTGPRTVRLLKDKLLMRRHLADTELGDVRFREVTDGREAEAFRTEVAGPIVLKPRDAAGSEHVHRVDSAAGCAAAWEEMRKAGFRSVLAEEYLPGLQLSAECFTVAGDHRVVVLTEALLDDDDPVARGFVAPARVSAAVRREVERRTRVLLDAVGLTEGPSHTEFRLTDRGPRLLESHNRVAGGLFDELVRRTTGTDLVRDTLAVPLGLVEPPGEPRAGEGAAAFRNLTPEPGTVLSVTEPPAGELGPGVDVTVTARPGGTVRPVRSVRDLTSGYVLATGADPDEAVRRCAAAARRVEVRTGPAHREEAGDGPAAA